MDKTGFNEVKKLFNHLCAAGMALMAFAMTLIIGLWVNNPFTTVVQRSIVAMVVFYIFGYLLSVLGLKVIRENFDSYIKPNNNNNTETEKSA